jgi:hypothetical protein
MTVTILVRVSYENIQMYLYIEHTHVSYVYTTAKKNIHRAIAMESMGVYYIGRLTLTDVCIH